MPWLQNKSESGSLHLVFILSGSWSLKFVYIILEPADFGICKTCDLHFIINFLNESVSYFTDTQVHFFFFSNYHNCPWSFKLEQNVVKLFSDSLLAGWYLAIILSSVFSASSKLRIISQKWSSHLENLCKLLFLH